MVNFFIIDDSKFIRAVEEKLLGKIGHEVIAKGSNGREAIDIYLDEWQFIDVILLDVVMPKMDGLRVLKELMGINPFAKIIMVTSISNSTIVQNCMNAGAKDYVVKPFKLSEFVKTIDKVIEM